MKKSPIDALREDMNDASREFRFIALAEDEAEAHYTEERAIQLRADGPKIGMTIPYGKASQTMRTRSGVQFVEVIEPGAFARSLANSSRSSRSDLIATYNHQSGSVLGRQANGTLTYVDGQRSLDVTATLAPEKFPFHKEVLGLIEDRYVIGSSFEFDAPDDGDDFSMRDDGMVVRHLNEVKLFSVSPVTHPAYLDSAAEKRSRVVEVVMRSVLDTDNRLDDLARLLKKLDNGKVPEVRSARLQAWIDRLQALMPEARNASPTPTTASSEPEVVEIDWATRIAFRERMLRIG